MVKPYRTPQGKFEQDNTRATGYALEDQIIIERLSISQAQKEITVNRSLKPLKSDRKTQKVERKSE